MSAPTRLVWCERINPALPFLMVSALAIVGAGVLAAAVAHAPSQKLVWAVAYLVLVVGASQAVFGAGQALLATRATSVSARVAEWTLFNLGNVGVIAGTLCSSQALVWAGTLLFAASLVVFLWATRSVRSGWTIFAYRTLLVLIGGSAVVGLVLTMVRAVA
ncbi:MAG: hypothetical protein ABI389_13295 [Rhodanobacter sp.]